MPDPKPPPSRRPSGAFAAVPVAVAPVEGPHRPNTQTLLAAGAQTADVAAAEDALMAMLGAPEDRRRGMRDVLLHLAHSKYVEGEVHRDRVLREYAIDVRLAYWHASERTARRSADPAVRPTVEDVCATLRAESAEHGSLPERDVRAILLIFGLSTAP